MREPAFTPGPWNVQSDGQIWCDDHPIVEKLCTGPWGDRAIDITNGNEFLAHHWGTVAGPEATANARLIAAAPALYEALEVIAGGCVDISDTAIIVGDGAKTVMAQVRAALSLALGDKQDG